MNRGRSNCTLQYLLSKVNMSAILIIRIALCCDDHLFISFNKFINKDKYIYKVNQ